MDYRQLGRTQIKVSSLCLGSMTWGEQNSASEAIAQIERAKAYGVNFLDTAEMYPVPPRAETYSKTEQIIGDYFKQRGDRADWVLASKIAGPGNGISYIRGGQLKHNREHIVAALDASLKRLQTDWIDLYQLHWPERPTNYFGQLGYRHQDSDFTPLEDTLEALDEQVKAGKIRHIGLSNETPWGTMKFLQLAEQRGWPRSVSIQNPYNLLNRSFEVGLAEIA
ncbi:MAG TPA: aldo/keto reductase, partial [Pseudomonas sp.]|nr:aldo/keto reductase [Pseudomonas sp.]